MQLLKISTLASMSLLILSCTQPTDEDVNLAPNVTPVTVVNNDVVSFTANATDPENENLTYQWNFGDNTSSNEENPTHTYSSSGTYTVILTVTDASGEKTITNTSILIEDQNTTINEAPIANPSFNVIGNSVEFMANAADNENDQLSFNWSFSDAESSNLENPTHEFLTSGSHSATLVVNDGTNNSVEKTVNFVIDNLAPVADFTYTESGLLVTVDASNSTDAENDELTFEWDFNSQSTQYGQTASFEFDSGGDKTIRLTVTDSQQNQSEIIKNINVSMERNFAPTASFELSDNGLIVTADASASSDPENDDLFYQWNFNDEFTSSLAQPSFEFASDGEKTISLIVSDTSNNTSMEVTQTITIMAPINASPVSYFDYNELAQENTYAFTALAIDVDSQSLSYSWSDNGVEFSTDENPTLTLVDDGYHTIELTVSDGNSSHDYSVQILIGDGVDQNQPVNLNLDLPKEYSLIDNGEILELGGNYESDFYDDSTIEDIYLEFTEDNWETILANNYDSETFLSGTLTYQGEVLSQVGIRYRGNTSYSRAGDKKSFAIELDWLVEGQDIDGYNFLKLNNAYEDPSNIREVLYNNLITDHIPAAKGSFVNVYVNGVNYGVYANVQKLDKDHTKEWFFDKDSARWRAEEPNSTEPGFHAGDSTLNNKGSQGSDYESFYTLKGTTDALDPWQNLADAAYTLGTAPQDSLVDELNPYFDIDAALWFLAVENLFTDDDGYINKGSMDYFVYLDVTTNRIMPIEFDGNSVLAAGAVDDEGGDTGGGGGRPGQGAEGAWDPFHKSDDTDYPLINILMANEELRQRYLAHYRTLVAESFDPTTVQAKITEYKNLISSHVQAADVRQYSDAEFEADITELSELVARRHTYVLANAEVDAQGVEINSVVDSVDGVASIRPTDVQSVLVQASVASNVNTASVNLYYGTGLVGTFTKLSMTDSDNNNVFEANIPAQAKSQFVRYYVEVIADDAANTATYSPVGAEHDVYIYQVQAGQNIQSDVVINELMSSNDTIVADETGEYEDWVELYNNSDQAVDISGYYLTDEDTNLTRWEFPSGTIIDANSTLTVWVDDDGMALEGLHTNFNLSANGESLYLVTPTLEFADVVHFGASNADESYARTPNAVGEFEWTTNPSFNQSNP